jgi:hypothetical protein
MSDQPTLTPEEARVLWTALVRTWLPMVGHDEAKSALDKLCRIGGGYHCRDCTELGTHSSRLGGFLCATHKTAENERWSSSRPELAAKHG